MMLGPVMARHHCPEAAVMRSAWIKGNCALVSHLADDESGGHLNDCLISRGLVNLVVCSILQFFWFWFLALVGRIIFMCLRLEFELIDDRVRSRGDKTHVNSESMAGDFVTAIILHRVPAGDAGYLNHRVLGFSHGLRVERTLIGLK